ncbi:TetR/AcrR family transcriptional regulator [Streptacidiphilus pinicola]|uniref:TetR/AcrR family transcriptional regulator n=1 Tax=Streptacidiphilus pinicola TaxID=2219663 RepID=A0A2X0K579_9ACTN|nr:TetR/AcrR family transcriptional regulator [Streptacidiphilus pinicola]
MIEKTSTPQSAASPAAPMRRRLLDGLAQSIREKGLQQTQVSDIVRNARTSKRSFYECFASKEACLADLADDWAETLRRAVATEVDRTAPWDEQIDAAVDAFLAAVARDPALSMTIPRELVLLGGQYSEVWEKDTEFYCAFYMELSRGPMMASAGVEPLSWERAVILVGGLTELINRVLRAGGSLEGAGDAMKESMKRLIGPR